MRNIKSIIASFSAIALCFICAMTCIKIIYFQLFSVLFKTILHCLVTSGIFICTVFAVYAIFSIFSKKTANWIASVLFGIIVFGEIGLTIYTNESGQLMGQELFLRPLSETIQTVAAAISLFWAIIITIAVIGGFALLAHIARKRLHGKWISFFILTLSIISVPSVFFIDNILDSNNVGAKNRETSKMWYLAMSNINSDHKAENTVVDYDETLIDAFLAEHPDYIVPDKHYPLDRIDNVPDVLGSYFRVSDTKPDIVIILVESLGIEMMGNGLAPYLDSLAQHSLYWPNCLATTIRSYGATPAITSSTIGPKGFQFGVMPEHNSLFKILKSNGYKTNAFYGGDFSFDCISEYLIAQDIDYMSDFYNEYRSGTDKTLGNWWGYFDHVMFKRSIEEIEKFDSPLFCMITTITNHEALNIKNEEKQQEYSSKCDAVIAQMPPEKAVEYNKNKKRFCTMLYTDDCIKDFINQYKKLPNFDNTIFVITGDHSSGLILNNRLDYHRVPLIIWSPMLEKTGTFKSIVTHNDIAPSLNALLRDKYHLTTPEYVHWIGDGLNTSSDMEFNKKMVHVNYTREMRELVYNNYLYWTKNQWEDEQVNKINQDFTLDIIYNDSLKSELGSKLKLYKYICRYTYYNNKLTQHPIFEVPNYTVYQEIRSNSKLVCKTPDKKPSEVGVNIFKLLDNVIIHDSISKVKITLDAEVFVNDSLWQDEYMDIVFECTDTQTNCKAYYIEKLSKFIKSDIIKKGKWYDLSVSKEFLIDNHSKKLSVYVSSVKYDDQWVGGSTLTIGRRYIKIEVE